MKPHVVVLGAGLAGLSAAYHLKRQSTVLEREQFVGGTARSFKLDGYTFDFTGHLLHLHTPYTKNLIRKLLKNDFYQCIRKALIFSNGTYTPYPYQANTLGLPSQVVEDCVLGILQRHLNAGAKQKPHNFLDWSLEIFGEGITNNFMRPYNEKLYQTAAADMTYDWCGSFVPTPKLEDVIRGAIDTHKKEFGYNATFLYPKNGGIQVLAESLAKKVNGIRLNTPIKKVLWREKRAILETGESLSYSHLVNTIPLDQFLKRMQSLPKDIKKYSKKLKSAGVLCMNIGVKRAKISDASWIYFPEKKFIFYRVGFPMNFTPHVVPKGCSSMYVEIPMKNVKGLSRSEIYKRTIQGLIDARILLKSDKIDVCQFLSIPHAYVIYNQDRKKVLPKIFKFLKKNRILSIGRYGAWKYSFMEEAVLDGKKAAEIINEGLL